MSEAVTCPAADSKAMVKADDFIVVFSGGRKGCRSLVDQFGYNKLVPWLARARCVCVYNTHDGTPLSQQLVGSCLVIASFRFTTTNPGF